jgi:hypothetical protein
MAVKASGPLSLTDDIALEFEDLPSHALSEFYKGTEIVPDIPDNINIPISGEISIGDFYGALKAIPKTIPSGVIMFYDTEDSDFVAPAGWSKYTSGDNNFIVSALDSSEIGSITPGSLGGSFPIITSSQDGLHTGTTSTFAHIATSTSGSAYGRSTSSTATQHRHTIDQINLDSAPLPYPPFKRLFAIKSTSETITIPVNGIVMSPIPPGTVDPFFWSQATTAQPMSIMLGKNTNINGGLDSPTGISPTWNTGVQSASSGSHNHLFIGSTATRGYSTTSRSIYNVSNAGTHTHNVSASLSISEIRAKVLKFWKTARTTVAPDKIILLFEGDTAQLPQGWKVCDGFDGTVDMRDYLLSISDALTDHDTILGTTTKVNLTVSLDENTWSHNHQGSLVTSNGNLLNMPHRSLSAPHSHTGSASNVENVYVPPTVKLAFIQYFEEPQNTIVEVIPSALTVEEGDTLNFTFNASNINDGTKIFYLIVGDGDINQGDFLGSLTGEFTINEGTGTVSIDINRDLTKEYVTENVRIKFYKDFELTNEIAESPSVNIVDTSFPVGTIPTGTVVLYDDPTENPVVPAGWAIDTNANHKDKLVLFANNQTEINTQSTGGWSQAKELNVYVSTNNGAHSFSTLTYTRVQNFSIVSGSAMNYPVSKGNHSHSVFASGSLTNLNNAGKIYPPFKRYHMLVRTGPATNVLPANSVIFAKFSPGSSWNQITYSPLVSNKVRRYTVLTGRSSSINSGVDSSGGIGTSVYKVSTTSGAHNHRDELATRGPTTTGAAESADANLVAGDHVHNVRISMTTADLRTISLNAWKTTTDTTVNASSEILVLFKETLANLPPGWYFANGTNGTLDTRGRYLSIASTENTHGELLGSSNSINFGAAFEDNVDYPTFARHGHSAGLAQRSIRATATAWHTTTNWPHSHFKSDYDTSTDYTMPYTRYAGIQYFFPGNSEDLTYNFSEHTFTNAGKTGRTGPTLAEVQAAYDTEWDQTLTNLNVSSSQTGKQKWLVPATGLYYIEAYGAQGGGISGGLGASVAGEFYLLQGEYLHIAVGQQGSVKTSTSTTQATSSGGGGASVVVRTSVATTIDDSILMLVAGGGGGCNSSTNLSDDRHGTISATGRPGSNNGTATTGGVNGLGGNYAYDTFDSRACGAGGGGVYGNGIGNTHIRGGQRWTAFSFSGGWDAATTTTTYDTFKSDGGFGAGGGAYYVYSNPTGFYSGAGGGGGYSGGGGGRTATNDQAYGGGGGSFNTGANQKNVGAVNQGHGRVYIKRLIVPEIPPPPPASYTVSVNDYSANEGTTITITVNSQFVDSGTTVYWDIEAVDEAITADDFNVTNGSIVLDAQGTGTSTVQFRNDNVWEGGRLSAERFKIRLFTDVDRSDLVARTEDISILDTSNPVIQITSGMGILYSGTATSSTTTISGWTNSLQNYINMSSRPLYIKGTDQQYRTSAPTSHDSTQTIGTASLGSVTSTENGSHTGSTFVGGNYGSTTVSASNGYPYASGAGANHTHNTTSPTLSSFSYPLPPTSFIEILVANSSSFVIPINGIVFCEDNPNPGYFAAFSKANYPAAVPRGSALRNTDQAAISPTQTVLTTSNGVHQHKINSDNYWFNAGNTFFWYLDTNEGGHQHSQDITLIVDALKSKNLKAWRSTTGSTTNSRLYNPNIIVMWFSTSTTIPSGWRLCDGTNGTIDMRDFYLSINSNLDHGAVISSDTRLKATYGNLQSTTAPHQHRGAYISNIRTNSGSTYHSNQVDWIHSHQSTIESKTLSSDTYPDIYKPATLSVRFIQRIPPVQQSPEYPYYNFVSHTFTNAGVTGNYGPTITDCKSAYLGKVWVDDARFFSVSSGKQKWTVPRSGYYRITARGAQGGSPTSTTGGLGAIIQGVFFLAKGDRIDIMVGQMPTSPTQYNDIAVGGGGGSFVVKDGGTTVSDILVIAGGGGGTGIDRPDAANASTTTSGKAPAIRPDSTAGSLISGYSIDGQGGSSYDSNSGGGGGFLTNGRSSGTTNSYSGRSYLNNSTGGSGSTGLLGGFGGGGSVVASSSFYRYGGGGGYSGGQGSDDFPSSFGISGVCGGGGGSYNNGIVSGAYVQSNTVGNQGHGRVEITFLDPAGSAELENVSGDISSVEILVVGGGGGGGSTWANSGAGGAGGGGLVYKTGQTYTSQTEYTITVGAGGRGDRGGYTSGSSPLPATNGSNSVGLQWRAIGGGAGGRSGSGAGKDGGSGGGGSGDTSTIGLSTQSSTLSGGFGNQGGLGGTGTNNNQGAGGGGGANNAGGNRSGGNSGAGGAGRAFSITGTSETYAGGGGGGRSNTGGHGAGGAGGGGAGGANKGSVGTNGTNYLGGGGGGAAYNYPNGAVNGGTGGAGVVIVAYPNTYPDLIVSAGLSVTRPSRSGFKVYRFVAGTGTISWPNP